MTCNPRMHTGIDLDPHMHTGISCHAICFGCGMCMMLCIHKILIHCATHVKILIHACLEERSLTRQKLIPVCIREVPICERAGIQKISHMGSPRMHNEIVRIWGLTYIYIFRFRFLSIDH
jgi:hypothetical protein